MLWDISDILDVVEAGVLSRDGDDLVVLLAVVVHPHQRDRASLDDTARERLVLD